MTRGPWRRPPRRTCRSPRRKGAESEAAGDVFQRCPCKRVYPAEIEFQNYRGSSVRTRTLPRSIVAPTEDLVTASAFFVSRRPLFPDT